MGCNLNMKEIRGFIAEDVTNLWRLDLTIATLDMSQVYIIEPEFDNKSPINRASKRQSFKKYPLNLAKARFSSIFFKILHFRQK